MNAYSKSSEERLSTCHFDLRRVFREALKVMDHTIICGHRGKEEQDRAFREGKSKVRWPDGMHNRTPSLAVDVMPYPVDWNDVERTFYFAGIVKGIAHCLGIPIRWGGDWNGDNRFRDERFRDLPHYELITPKEPQEVCHDD